MVAISISPAAALKWTWGKRHCVAHCIASIENEMGFERRRNGRLYYYRAQRRDGRVVKEYVGGGAKGLAAAAEDEARRAAILLAKQAYQAVCRSIAELASEIDELGDLVEQLATGQLVAAGFKKHHRQWRPSKNGPARRRSNR
jgi:hypothetical protein